MSGLPVLAYLKSSQVSTYPGRLLYLIRSKSIKAFIPFFLHLVVIIILTVPFFSWAEEPSRIELTPEEKAWLEEHPNVTFGFTDSFEPFLIRGVRDQHIGILVDLLKELNSQLGTHFALEVDSWPVILEKVKQKEMGAVLGVAHHTADAFGLLKTVPYYTVYPTFFAREDAPFAIKSLDDLRGKSVAILAKAKVMENILEPYGSDVEISRHPDNLTALQMVFEGKVDLAFGLSTHSYYINKYGLLGVKPVHTLLERPSKVGMAVRTDWPELVSILNKAILALQEDEMPRIIDKWFGEWPQISAKKVHLTPEEKAWLAQNHTIRVRFNQHPPYFYLKDDKVVGLAVDLLNKVSKRAGVTFQQEGQSHFSDLLKGLIEHTGPDVVSAIMPTPKREGDILFTEPYITSPRFIFTRDDAPFVSSIENLFGKKVAVVNGYVTHRYLAENYPNIDLLVYNTADEALRAVSSGKAIAYIGDLISTPAIINEFGLKNLKAASPSGLPDHPLAMGVRNDWPELRDILDKALDAIPAEEKAAIINKWSTIRFEYGISSDDIMKWSLIFIISASAIILLFVVWNKQLSSKVEKRTDQLMETESRFRATFEQAAVGVAHVSLDGKFLRVNQKFCDIAGYPEDEMLDLAFQDITHPDDLDADLGYVQQVLKGNRENYSIDKRYLRKDGSIVWINLTVSLLFDRGGKPKYFVSIIKDISDRKQAEEALEVSYGYLKHMISAVPDAIFRVKLPERAIEWAEDSHNIMGLGSNPEYVQGQSTLDIFADIDAYNRFGEIQRKAIQEGKSFMRTEIMLRRKDGSIFPADVTGTFYRENGEVTKITAIVRDISERRQIEESLQQSYDFQEHLNTTVPDVVFSIKMPERIVEWVNDSYNILGYEPEECIGESTEKFYANPEGYQAMGSLLQDAISEGEKVLLTEAMLRRKNGEVFPAEVNVSVYRENGQVVSITGLLRDISERKQAEAALNKSYQEIEKLQKQLQAESAYLQEEIRLEHNFENIIGNSNAIQYAFFKVEQVAETDSSVLILGETGTGKELIARAIHHNSQRHDRPLIKINCATLPANLIESELFGHEKGSFTGAAARHMGRFEVADGSTLFLDEIGELPLELQAKLLRAIEDGEFERLGSTKTIKVDVRIIAATNRELEMDVKEGRFREDLWYRLNVFPITLPPLRDRVADIPLIVQYYLDLFTRKMGKKTKSIPTKFMETLQSYTWPGNVRELQNVIERAVISTAGAKLQLPEEFIRMDQAASTSENFKPLRDMERDYIVSVLEKTGWKVSGKNSAAEILGLDRSTLRARMKKLGISK